MMQNADVIGAILADAIYAVVIAIFVTRLLGRPELGHRLGLVLMIAAVPLVYLLAIAPSLKRPALYTIQISLMLVYLVIEFLLDYILKVEFRNDRWMVIPYVMIFFAGTGGMIGVASRAGRAWAISAIVLFLVMALLAFVQRAIVGL